MNIKPKTIYNLICEYCKKEFTRDSRHGHYLRGKKKRIFCSLACCGLGTYQRPLIECKECGIKFTRKANSLRKSKNNFCSYSCNGFYQNKHKNRGNRRSKLEIWLEQQLISLYPQLQFEFNKTHHINAELDIYIPSLKLAFELNGIFHYEPIFRRG